MSFGTGHVLRPAGPSALALYLEIDPTELSRSGRSRIADRRSIAQYVNDRPYAASSFLTVALWRLLRSELRALGSLYGEMAALPSRITVEIPVLAARDGGAELVRQLFEPLGYELAIETQPLDEQYPQWGDSPYLSVRLSGNVSLQDCFSHMYVLVPVLDAHKHYWIDQDEVDKLIEIGGDWLAGHPQRELISRRFLRSIHDLAREAQSRLAVDESGDDEEDDNDGEERIEERIGLNRQRHLRILELLKQAGARSVLDLGCSEGRLLKLMLEDGGFERLTGMDVSTAALRRAERVLWLERLPQERRERIRLIQGSLTYLDARLRGHDAAVLAEVIEHLDEERLRSMELSVFGDATPRCVIVTTPNVEYNVLFVGLAAGALRHPDHRFEWSRQQFRQWAERVAEEFSYKVEFTGIGEEHAEHGCPTQLGVFRR